MNKYDNTLSKEIRQKNFITIVNLFHNNFYDYSLVGYINNITNIRL
jgi:hypothetical protein